MSTEKYDGIKENHDNPPPPIYFNILFYGLILVALAYAAYYLFGGWSSHDEFRENMATYQSTYNISPGSDDQK